MKELLQFISEGGSVTRFHARPGIKPDTDAHHSHGVALLCSILAGSAPKLLPGYDTGDCAQCTRASTTLLMAALTHDLAEQKYSDVNAPAKIEMHISTRLADLENKELSKYGLNYEQFLSAEERSILKLADCLDGLMYCNRELALGNRNVQLIWSRYCEYITTVLAVGLPVDIALRASHVFEAIRDIHREVTGASGPSFNVFAKEAADGGE